MGWFVRQTQGRGEGAFLQEQGRYLRAAGVDRALEALSGPYGVRRFLVHFAQRGAQVRVQDIESLPLQWGGGPPPPDPGEARRTELERALTRLHRNMGVGPRWERGVLGFVRDREGQSVLFPLFDEDVELADLAALPLPPPPGHPLEDPAYRSLLVAQEHRMLEIHARTHHTGGWDVWHLSGDRLRLHYGDEQRSHRCRVLGLYQPQRSRFLWQAEPPLSSPLAAFQERSILLDWNAANELALLAVAHVQADWLFVGALEDERALFAAVWG